ncbi:MAG: VOC family protein [Anaerolineae bacterium]|nr:VOC family protein [Anaerolineae bacterium]
MKTSYRIPLMRRVDCIRLYVPNLDAGLAFYRDRLGHELIWRTERAAGLRMLDTDTEIVLQSDDEKQEIDFMVESADVAAGQFEQAGGKIVVPVFDIQIGCCVVVEAPWGNQLVLPDMSTGLLATDADGNVVGNVWVPSLCRV